MQYSPTLYYQFDPFYSNRVVNIKVRILNFAAKFKKYFNFLHIHTGLVAGLNKDLGKLYIMIEGLKIVTANMNYESAKIEYPIAKKALEKFTRMYFKLEEVNFFGTKETRQIAETILLDFYAIDSQMRAIVYENTKRPDSDIELIENASLISINALQNI